MARWLGPFTARDLAYALGVPPQMGEQFVKALLFHRLATDTGDAAQGPDGEEPIYEMEPLPEGQTNREQRMPAHIQAIIEMGGFEILEPRGLPIRIRTERDQRKSLSTPGARQAHRMREKAWRDQQEAIRKRQEQPQKEAKWKRRGKGGAAITIIPKVKAIEESEEAVGDDD